MTLPGWKRMMVISDITVNHRWMCPDGLLARRTRKMFLIFRLYVPLVITQTSGLYIPNTDLWCKRDSSAQMYIFLLFLYKRWNKEKLWEQKWLWFYWRLKVWWWSYKNMWRYSWWLMYFYQNVFPPSTQNILWKP